MIPNFIWRNIPKAFRKWIIVRIAGFKHDGATSFLARTSDIKRQMRLYSQRRRNKKLGRLKNINRKHKEHHAIMQRQRGVCKLCKRTGRLTIDHIIPLSQGGTNNRQNLQLLCRTCHAKKDGCAPNP